VRATPIILMLVAACGHHAGGAAAAGGSRAERADVWIYRDLSTGLVRRGSTLDTYRLVLAGERATLTVTAAATDHRRQRATGPLTGWRDTTTRTFTGTITVDGDARILDLHEDGSDLVWRWSCEPHAYDVAPADAVRTASSDDDDDDCGDEGRWSKPTRLVDVLACGDLAAGDPDQLEGIFAFARAPGLEHLFVDDDCLSGGGLRAIPRDGSVAPVRTD
jgi:hypothetical protein